MDWQDRIEKVPGILTGKPVIKDTRISVEQIVGHLNGAWTEEDIIEGYGLTDEAVFGSEEERRKEIVLYCEYHRNKALQESDWQGRIEKAPNILSGKPIIKGTRISIEQIVGHLYGGWSDNDIITSYSHITREDIEACRQFAATGEPLSPTTWAEFEANILGDCQASKPKD